MMTKRSYRLVGTLPWLLLLATCGTEETTGPRVRMTLDNAALRDDMREIRLRGYRDVSGLGCSGHALSSVPSATPQPDLPILPTDWSLTFPAEGGHWVFHVLGGNDDFRIDGPKPLAEGCLSADISGGSSPTLELQIFDLRPEYCGDTVLDPGEECDDGNQVSGDGCSGVEGLDGWCRWESGVCGNSRVDADETCDDGNTTDGDGCSAACQTEVFRVNVQYFDEEQSQPRLAAGTDGSGNGGFAAAWTDESGDTPIDRSPPTAVIGFFDERGSPTAGPTGAFYEYPINTMAHRFGAQNQPAVGWGSEGYLAAYVDAQVGDWDLYILVYGTDRRLLWAEERLASSDPDTPAANEQQPVVGSHPTYAGYVVVWATGAVGSRRVRLRTFTGAGEPGGDDIVPDPGSSADQYLPAVAMASTGAFAVAWVEGSANSTIRLARFAADGTISGAVEQVETTMTGNQSEPSLAYDDDGRLLVVWGDGGTSGVRGRLYDAAGTAAGGDFAISTRAMNPGTPESARLTTGVAGAGDLFLVAWAGTIENVVEARLVGGHETFVRNRVSGDDGPFLVASPVGANRARAAVAPPNGDGERTGMIAWQERDGDSSGGDTTDPPGGIFGRVLPVP